MFYYLLVVLSCVCLKAESTDIAAVYTHGVLVVPNAESLTSVLKAEDLYLKVLQNFTFPVALAHEPQKGTLFLADLNNEETDVFSINSRDEAVSVYSLVSKFGSSAIESMIYDPSDHKLIWTDSAKNGIYSAALPKDADTEISPTVVFNDDVYKPRGITIDYCNRDVYWTERHQERTIEKFNMDTKTVTKVARAKDNIYYQAIDFNSFTNELIWAETEGDDESKSSCSIMVMGASSTEPRLLASIESCYPFSITSDKDFIYWSDWSRNGIMKLSRSDPSDLKMLVDAPKIKTEFGLHDGAFGIVNMNKHSVKDLDHLCPQSFGLYKKKEIVPIRTSSNVPISPKFRNTISARLATENYDLMEQERRPTVMDEAASSSAATFHDFSLRRLRMAVGILTVVAVFFMTTTIILLTRSFCANQSMFKGIILLFSSSQLSDPSPTHTKRSKPYKRFGSSKTKAMEGALCPRGAADGIQIEIEDCCQMTLCDTPCELKMMKAKKGNKEKESKKAEDKKCLLEN